MEQLPRQRLCLMQCHAVVGAGYTGQDRLDELVFQCIGQRVDVLIVGIERRFVDAGHRTQVFYLDFFQGVLLPQFHESLFDGAVGTGDTDVHKIHLFRVLVDYPTVFVFRRWTRPRGFFTMKAVPLILLFYRAGPWRPVPLRCGGTPPAWGSSGCADAHRRSSGSAGTRAYPPPAG